MVRFINNLFHFNSSSNQKLAGANCESIQLLGNGLFEIQAAGVARYQDNLGLIAPADLSENIWHHAPAQLLADKMISGKARVIDIAIDNHTIGYCPSFISTRYLEWLRQWGMEQAKVNCGARIRRQARSGGESQLFVHLDIDDQFSMTTTATL